MSSLTPNLAAILLLSLASVTTTTGVFAFTAGASARGVNRAETSLSAELVVPGMWSGGLNFGKGEFRFYRSFGSFMSPFTEEDRQAFPEAFNLPEGVYEVSMVKPLGIVFEEIEAGEGVFVQELVVG